jgi:hypothetical protein
MHASGAVHTFPHAPQLLSSDVRSLHELPQRLRPAAHEQFLPFLSQQAPFVQVAQPLLPQAPQFAVSV